MLITCSCPGGTLFTTPATFTADPTPIHARYWLRAVPYGAEGTWESSFPVRVRMKCMQWLL